MFSQFCLFYEWNITATNTVAPLAPLINNKHTENWSFHTFYTYIYSRTVLYTEIHSHAFYLWKKE